jgi:hypothetical protein
MKMNQSTAPCQAGNPHSTRLFLKIKNTGSLLVTGLLFVMQGMTQLSHTASLSGPPVGPRDVSPYAVIVNIHGDDGFYLKRKASLIEKNTVVKGEIVLGSPYLFYEWYDGTIETTDGRTYHYPLRYDLYGQTVIFKRGNDSLEVNEDIKEFSLSIPVGDTIIRSRFINSGQYKKSGRPSYYELLIDDSKGQLLKLTRKKIAVVDMQVLVITKNKKYFNPESEYYYYNKQTSSIDKIGNGNNIKKLLQVKDTDTINAKIENTNFTNEDELIGFFKEYFGKKG